MSKSNFKIMLVDDDPVLVEMHSALLEMDDYSVLVAEDGEQALEILEREHENVGVVVSDINMPKMDGYELCQKIKSNEATKNIPIIFVSAYTGLEEKIKGYSVGADDYIPKPVNEEELKRKIHVLLGIREKQSSLSKQVAESQSMIMQTMVFSSELGKVVEFYKKVLNARDYKEIADYYFEVVSDFGLISIIQVYTPKETLNLSVSGIVTPLEANVIELARDKGRFFDFGARTIVNYKNFSILIKNMPLGDEEKCGRIKDILGMLGNGIEEKIGQLNSEIIAMKKDSMIMSIRESISNIEKLFAEVQKENISAIEDMYEQVHQAIMILGLTEEQEDNIQHITETCLERSNRAFYKGVNITENLKNIYEQFQHVTGSSTKK